jgi:hypothetical protein
MSEPVSIAAIVISAVTAIGGVLTALHIRKMNSGCLSCDCTPSTPISRSPTVSKPIILQPIKISEEVNGQATVKSSKDSEN